MCITLFQENIYTIKTNIYDDILKDTSNKYILKVTVKAKWVQNIIFNISMASNRNTNLLIL